MMRSLDPYLQLPIPALNNAWARLCCQPDGRHQLSESNKLHEALSVRLVFIEGTLLRCLSTPSQALELPDSWQALHTSNHAVP